MPSFNWLLHHNHYLQTIKKPNQAENLFPAEPHTSLKKSSYSSYLCELCTEISIITLETNQYWHLAHRIEYWASRETQIQNKCKLKIEIRTVSWCVPCFMCVSKSINKYRNCFYVIGGAWSAKKKYLYLFMQYLYQ